VRCAVQCPPFDLEGGFGHRVAEHLGVAVVLTPWQQHRIAQDVPPHEGHHGIRVYVLGREAGAHHVVAGAHDLDTHTVQVGVDVPSAQEQGATGLQHDMMQQGEHSDSRIPRMKACHDRQPPRPRFGDGGYLPGEATQVGARREQPRHDGSVPALDEALEQGRTRPAHLLETVAHHVVGRKATHGLESGEGDHHLGFGPRVAIGAGGIVERQTGGLLAGIAHRRLLGVGMQLQRQRTGGSEQLHQEGERSRRVDQGGARHR